MGILKRQTFNNGTEGEQVSSINSGTSGDALLESTGTGTRTYAAASALRGKKGLAVSGTATISSVDMALTALFGEASTQIYFRVVSPATSNNVFLRFMSNSTTTLGRLRLNPANTISLLDFAAGVLATSVAVTTGSTYRLQMQMRKGTGTTDGMLAYQLYDDADILLSSFSSSTVNAGTVDAERIAAGKITAAGNLTVDLDEFAVRDDAIAIDPVAIDTVTAPSQALLLESGVVLFTESSLSLFSFLFGKQ